MQQLVDRPPLLAAVSEGLREAPVVALLGARQVGKTTLARQLAAAWPGSTRVFDLEVAATREALAQTPEAILRGSNGLVVVDEVQRMPALFEVLRPICDDRSRKAVFLLLGSASWDLIKGVSETLAGRMLFVDVAGLSLAEVGGDHQSRLWMRGGFPRAWLASSSAAWRRWMESFTQTFLERDIPGLGSRAPPTAIGRFWRMLAHYHPGMNRRNGRLRQPRHGVGSGLERSSVLRTRRNDPVTLWPAVEGGPRSPHPGG